MQSTVTRVLREASLLPRRRPTGNPNSSALVLGPADTADPARYGDSVCSWAYQASRSGQACADRIARLAAVLVDNAHRHTRSGLPGGAVEIALTRSRFQIELAVTDDGADQGADGWYPFPRLRPRGGGLHLVDRLSLYWDWIGSAGLPITVRALISR
ncbi:ATP-binding protein [Nocardiopsis algeriensis]|uniref:ATP-binding protein n=1 Tax=Nocardiopsis algeriensis TaxID=1478215 RepID=A0A841IPL6_9ACTN|nr:ATP-binding protein [Nocardiopsis algeriensis]MBB6119206.1 hypothetical protein [Nocardiopsis algeriensis]